MLMSNDFSMQTLFGREKHKSVVDITKIDAYYVNFASFFGFSIHNITRKLQENNRIMNNNK